MKVRIGGGWYDILKSLFENPIFSSLVEFVKLEYQNFDCYPKGKDIFRAFDTTVFNELKVVILGQDPYPNPNQAHGLCFSVPDKIIHPPSLVNIFKELESDIGLRYPKSGDLTRWGQQGILLLNTTLTVRKGQPQSHQNQGWEWFTDNVIKIISDRKQHIVFLLWGSYAKAKQTLIDASKHLILRSGHPSPLSANKGYWFENKHFSKTNAYLQSNGLMPIEW